jgi:hypothetical protein
MPNPWYQIVEFGSSANPHYLCWQQTWVTFSFMKKGRSRGGAGKAVDMPDQKM